MDIKTHLSLNHITLRPGQEWALEVAEWNFFIVTDGLGYLFEGSTLRELPVDSVFVLTSKSRGEVRASQLNSLQLSYFSLSPTMLAGLFTFAERFYFETTQESIRFFPENHRVVNEFKRLIEVAQPNAPSLTLRCQMLQVLVATVGAELSPVKKEKINCSSRYRFQSLMRQMAEGELLYHSISKLAEYCGCGSRHFNRLFVDYFGCTFSAKQTELRLLRAKHMLLETEASILEVARENGFPQLELFNNLFKRTFGMTPTEWRGQLGRKKAPLPPDRLAPALLPKQIVTHSR